MGDHWVSFAMLSLIAYIIYGKSLSELSRDSTGDFKANSPVMIVLILIFCSFILLMIGIILWICFSC